MKFIDRIRANTSFLAEYTQAMSLLYSSGIFEALREHGRLKHLVPATPNYIEALAAQAEYSRGYNQALDDLLTFREKFLDPSPQAVPPMRFGALERALEQGDLTQEEIDELERSK